MKLLINTSNLNKGGALQVAHSFLNEIKSNMEDTFYVVLSVELSHQIQIDDFSINFKFFIYSLKPNLVKSFLGRNSFLTNIENKYHPDCIFTVFGPAYWIPKTPHVVGFADGWCYNLESIAWNRISLFTKIKFKAIVKLKNYKIIQEADVLIVETDDAKKRILNTLDKMSPPIEVVGNTFSGIYNLKAFANYKLIPISINKFKLISISANYSHKNLRIIREVIPILEKRGLKFHFYLTLKKVEFDKMFGKFDANVTNLGIIDNKFCPSIYKQCDALFLPTLLETFTASYPEAMKSEIPILTSDLSFAHDICGEAAEYFDPLNPEDIANKIEYIINNSDRRNYLIQQGKKRLETFETSSSRANKYMAICNKLTRK